MRALGAPDHIIDKHRLAWEKQQPEYPFVEVYPENIAAFAVFITMGNQWEYPSAMGGRLTLPLTEIRACIEGLGVPDPHDTFRRVTRMADGARPVLLDRMKKKA